MYFVSSRRAVQDSRYRRVDWRQQIYFLIISINNNDSNIFTLTLLPVFLFLQVLCLYKALHSADVSKDWPGDQLQPMVKFYTARSLRLKTRPVAR